MKPVRENEENTDDNAHIKGPLVSVVICVYNAGEYLRPSLLSIIHQTYRNLDILIIDDGSTDGCLDSVQDLLMDRRVRCIRQANATKPVALNRALTHVRGEFYAVHDADDVSHPRRIERQVHALLDNPDVAAVFTGNELILNGRSLAPTFGAKSSAECRNDIDKFRMPANPPTGMYRMSLVGEFRYDASLPIGEDLDYIFRVGEQYPMMVLGECLYGYRFHLNSLTKRDPQRRDQFVHEMLKRACERRGMNYRELFLSAPRHRRRSSNTIMDNNIAAYFIESTLDQCRAGHRINALRTGLECVRIHPLDPHYYKALVYSALPITAIELIRRRSSSAEF